MKRTYLNPPGVPNWSSLFSQAVSVQAGGSKIVYVSGQVGVTEDQVLWGDGSLSAQARRALDNLSLVLADAGCTIEHVTKLTVIHDELDAAPKTAANVAGGWSFVLSGLKTLLETGEPLGN